MEIKFKDVDYNYKKVNYLEKEVLENINVKIKEGIITGIIGKNGSGKSTFVELIDALLLPSKGTITVDQFVIGKEDLDKNMLRFNLGLVMQNPEDSFFNKTVREELEFYIRFYNYRINEANKRLSSVLKMVGLDESYLARDILTLSEGEMRKLAIATVLIYNPKIVIFDEPTAYLDGKSKKELVKLIRLLKNRYKKTIIIVSQDVDLIHMLSDYIIVLNNKKIVLEGNKYELFTNSKELKKYGIRKPRIIEFSDRVLEKKNIKLGYRDDINDLIKDIYRNIK